MAIRDQLTALLSFFLLLVAGNAFIGGAHAEAQDESILNGEMARLNNQSLLWGPYRPNLYFGIRPRLPKSIMTALMWAKVDNYVDVQNSRSHFPHSTYLQARMVLILRRYRFPVYLRAERGNGWLWMGGI
jgi:hypothetical protein